MLLDIKKNIHIIRRIRNVSYNLQLYVNLFNKFYYEKKHD